MKRSKCFRSYFSSSRRSCKELAVFNPMLKVIFTSFHTLNESVLNYSLLEEIYMTIDTILSMRGITFLRCFTDYEGSVKVATQKPFGIP